MDIVISGSTPRCGSTMVQRVFNRREKTLIWGENKIAIGKMFQIQKAIERNLDSIKKHTSEYFESDKDPSLWIANINPHQNIEEAVVSAAKAFCDTYYNLYRNQYDTVGFKEIWQSGGALEVLMKAYPKIQVVCLIRHPVDVWRSIGHASLKNENAPMNFVQGWNKFSNDYIQLASYKTNIHLLRYEDIVARKKETLDLLQYLARISSEEMNQVLDIKVGGTKEYKKNRPQFQIDLIREHCAEVMKKLGYE